MAINIDRSKVEKYSKLELLAKQAVEGFITGLHKSPYHGFSVEFAEHRLYNNGESTRHIDWKLYAKTERLFVKRYEEETNLRCQIVIDHSASMNFPKDVSIESEEFNKLKFAAYASASLIELLRKQRDAVGVSFFNEKVTVHTPAKSSSTHHRFLFHKLEEMLEESLTSSNNSTAVVDALHEISEKIHKRSLVVIFSDMMDNSNKNDELFLALQHLKHNKHEVILFHTVDSSKEIEFDYEDRPYTFIDMESGEEVKVNPTAIRETYEKEVRKSFNELKSKCGQYGIDFVEADINKGINQTLLTYLIKRSKVF